VLLADVPAAFYQGGIEENTEERSQVRSRDSEGFVE